MAKVAALRNRFALVILGLFLALSIERLASRTSAAAFAFSQQMATMRWTAQRPSQARTGSPSLRRAAASEQDSAEQSTTEKGPTPPVDLPEVNYFTTLAAMHCIEDGCPVEEAEEIYGKLVRDEHRLEESIEQLQATSDEESSGAADEVHVKEQAMNAFHTLQERLQEAVGDRDLTAELAKDLVMSLGFGSGPTAGFLRLKRKNWGVAAR
mmetsp:Transcript_96633/g.207339  ORF Transcript_96633/g.207339 Transcript_96633/m.207339 type:complete len:210 (+) Transcript_96633:78-707(+)